MLQAIPLRLEQVHGSEIFSSDVGNRSTNRLKILQKIWKYLLTVIPYNGMEIQLDVMKNALHSWYDAIRIVMTVNCKWPLDLYMALKIVLKILFWYIMGGSAGVPSTGPDNVS
jgi:hypothetical protein